MRKILSLLCVVLSGAAAFAQKADSGKAAPKGGQPPVTWWFVFALLFLLVGLGYLFWRNGRGAQGVLSRSLGSTRARRGSSDASSRSRPGRTSSKRKTGFTQIQDTPPSDRNALLAGVEKAPEAEAVAGPEALLPPEEIPKPEPAIAQPEAAVEAAAPEIFYMTVPAADGSFPVASKKRQPHGCLYSFEVRPDNPFEAHIRFAGSEADMRNAQAFRDLELLPACSFSNRPQENSFQFEQTPGRAILDKEVWAIKEKIAIRFV